MVHIIRTKYGWAVTSHDEGLLAHFEGDLGFHPAEEFAIRWLKGDREKQPDPLPPQIRVQFEKMQAGQSVPPSPVTASPAAEAVENKLPKTNQDRSANVQPRVV